VAQIKAAQAFLYDVTVILPDGNDQEILVSSAQKLMAGDTLIVTIGGGKTKLAVIEAAGIMHPQSAPGSRSNPRCFIRRDQTGRAVARA
jgi:hypothetical protein